MKIILDNSKCEGHGRCYALAPELFDADDEGYSVLKITGDVPAGSEEHATLASANCPEFAITVED
ncbi:MAG TPA: ferredoxin [Acidimicrobiales bacterium]|nr:ferredoxin [Acidimicrobiales bacterium]